MIPSSSLVPENDPTVLFTTAGMHPLVPYLLGEKHPEGTRLCNVQRCVRTDDIDEVGDETHLTFFEMLGNWSLGDYLKEDAIKWSYEFLTSPEQLGIDKNRLAVSVFAGDEDAPFDEESFNIWRSLGVDEKRIAKLPKKDNWWGPAGQTGPCGPDTEMFVWTGDEDAPDEFNPEDKKWVEVWNDVFMQYNKTAEGRYEPLAQKNVDTGMGLERMLAILNGEPDIYKTELFWPIIEKLEELSGKKYEENKKAFRIIADHIKAAVFIINDGVTPSNKYQGYVLRRLVRRAIRYGRLFGIKRDFVVEIAGIVRNIYEDNHNDVRQNNDVLEEEGKKFLALLLGVEPKKNELLRMINRIKEGTAEQKDERLLKYYSKAAKTDLVEKWNNLANLNRQDRESYVYEEISPAVAYVLETTDGYPHEIFFEDLGIKFASASKYLDFFKKHQELSRTASSGMFKGGLADNSEQTTKYHTAAHLMLVALKQVLGDHVEQKGSNITAERLRFDFNNPEKLTEEQIKRVEEIVNEQISKNLPVTMAEMSLDEAKSSGAHGTFDDRYGNKVKVYTIGDPQNPFSREICGGPHVKNTSELGHFKIIKEESSSSGVRRIKAVLQ